MSRFQLFTKRWVRHAFLATLGMTALTKTSNAQTYFWGINADGTWDTTSNNWLLNNTGALTAFPNSGTPAAVFGGWITANRTIAVAAGGITTGALTFDNAGSFAFTIGTASNNITINNGASDSEIRVNRGFIGASNYNGAGGNTITGSNVIFNNNLNVINDSAFGTTGLTIAGNIIRAAAGGQIVFSGQGNTLISGAIDANVTGGLVKNGLGTVTLSGAANAFSGGVTINGGVLGINSNNTMLGAAGNAVTINNGGTFRFNNTVSLARNFTLNGNAGIDLASATTGTITGVLSGPSTANFIVSMTGGTTTPILSLEGVNTFAGNVVVGRPGQLIGSVYSQRSHALAGDAFGPNLRLQGSGSLASATSITVNRDSRLTITQPATGAATTGRTGSAGLTFNGARFNYNRGDNGGAALTENFGALTLSGTNLFTVSDVAGPAAGTTLNFASLNRVDNGTLWFSYDTAATNAGLGGTPSATNMNFLVTGLSALPNLGTTSAGIIPWAAGADAATDGIDVTRLITYDTNGFRPLAASEFIDLTSNSLATVAAGSNVYNNFGTQTLSGNLTINSYNSASVVSTINGTGTLTISSGAVAVFNTLTVDGPSINFGATGYFHHGWNIAITGTTSQITGSNGVVVSGLGGFSAINSYQLRFSNTQGNPFTGGLFINNAAGVTFTQDNQLGAAGGGITLNGGQLLTGTTVSLGATRQITAGTLGGVIGQTAANNTLTIPGLIAGSGQMQFGGGSTANAAGVVALTNASANTYTGGTIIGTGILQISNTNQLGTGSILFNGGTLRAAGTLNFTVPTTLVANSTLDTQTNPVTLTNLNGSGGALGISAGSLTLTKNGTGTLTITGDSTLAGTIAVNAGGLRLAGTAGALRDLSAVTFATGTTFTIDNTAGYLADRFSNSAAMTFNGTTFSYLPGSVALTDPAERLGTLSVLSGSNVFSVTGSSASPTILRLRNLTATAGITIRGTDLGGTSGNFTRVYIDGLTSNVNVLSNVFYANTPGTAVSNSPAGYDVLLGIVPFTPIVVTGTGINNLAAPLTPTFSAFSSTGDTTAVTGAHIFSLTLDGGSTLTLTGGNAAVAPPTTPNNNNTADGTLLLFGGGLTSQNGAKTIDSATARTISFGTSTGNLTTTSDLTLTTNVGLLGTAGLIKSGAGVLNLNGNINITGGAIQATAGTFNIGATSTLNAAAILEANGTGTLNIPALAAAIATVRSATGGTVNINGANTVTTLSSTGGIINVNATSTIATLNTAAGTVNINANTTATATTSTGGTINIASGIDLTTPATTVNGNIAGAGRVALTPAAVALISFTGTSNTWTGGILGNANTRLLATSTNAFGTGLIDLTAQAASSTFLNPTIGYNFGAIGASGTLPNNIAFTTTAGLSIFIAQNTGAVAGQTLTLSGVLSGGSATSNFVVDESGVSQANVVRLTNPANTFEGTLRADFGTLAFTSDAALGNPNNGITLNNGGINVNGDIRFDANNITLAATRSILVNAQSSINTNGNNATIAGAITGPAANELQKRGAGNLTLTSTTSTFAGPITIAQGRLIVNGNLPGSAAGVPITINSGGSLGGTGTIGDASTIRNITLAGGTLAPGNSIGTLTVSNTGNVTTFGPGSSYQVEYNITGAPSNGVSHDFFNSAGSLTVTATVANRFNINLVYLGGSTGTPVTLSIATFGTAPTIDSTLFNFTGDFTGTPTISAVGNDVQISFTPVPEPASIVLLSAVGLGCFYRNRRRNAISE